MSLGGRSEQFWIVTISAVFSKLQNMKKLWFLQINHCLFEFSKILPQNDLPVLCCKENACSPLIFCFTFVHRLQIHHIWTDDFILQIRRAENQVFNVPRSYLLSLSSFPCLIHKAQCEFVACKEGKTWLRARISPCIRNSGFTNKAHLCPNQNSKILEAPCSPLGLETSSGKLPGSKKLPKFPKMNPYRVTSNLLRNGDWRGLAEAEKRVFLENNFFELFHFSIVPFQSMLIGASEEK